MKNTRLYFDKQFTPILQTELYINFLGELEPNISKDVIPVLSPIPNNGIDMGYGIPSSEYGYYDASMQELLDNPFIFKTANFHSPNLIGFMSKRFDDYGDYIYCPASVAVGDISVFNEGVDSGDIICTFQVTNIIAEDSEGTSLTLDNYDFIKAYTKFPVDELSESWQIPLTSRFYIDDPAIHYPAGFKWVKFTVTINAGYSITPGSKYSKYFFVTAQAGVSEKQYVFYVINPTYREPAIYINVTGDTGNFYMENVDIVTNVHQANLSKQADGTWTLDFSYDLKDGPIEMLGVRNTITGITNDTIKQNSLIYTDTTYGPKPVTFRVWEIN